MSEPLELVDPGRWSDLSGGRPIPFEAWRKLESMSPLFVDDGCSSFPDQVFSWLAWITFGRAGPWVLKWACRVHDWQVCTRCHPPGSMTDVELKRTNKEFKQELVAFLPRFGKQMGYLMFRGVWAARGSGYFDSCGKDPQGVNDEQLAYGLCRHSMPEPEWMRG